jgi:hypothetical protein
MVAMFLVTFFALINLISVNLMKQSYTLVGLSGLLLLLAAFLAFEAMRILRKKC